MLILFFVVTYSIAFRYLRGYCRSVVAFGGEVPWWMDFNYDSTDFIIIGTVLLVLGAFTKLMFTLP